MKRFFPFFNNVCNFLSFCKKGWEARYVGNTPRRLNKFYSITLGAFLLVCVAGEAFGQQVLITDANKKKLADLSVQLNKKHLADHERVLALAKKYGWPIFRKTKNGGAIALQGVNGRGFPIYVATTDNIIAAATTGTNTVQPGGSLGLNLSGSSPGLLNKIAIWDGGSVYAAHQEFAGKTITEHDNAPVIDHSTHVAGTMIARGVNPLVKGMAFNATTLQSYFFDNDVAEMTAAAANLIVSNHSYATASGWNIDLTNNHWQWYGLPGDTVDYKFGFYGAYAQAFDHIAYSAPYYLIVAGAGNYRGYPGPPVGGEYYGYKSDTDPTVVDKGPRPAGISSNSGYEVIADFANAKNILTVGAINPLPNGPTNSQDIAIASFSSWGPTNDGRIKPDIVGDGVNVLSTGSNSPTDYITLSGTSMATPNVSGSLYLLQEYYAQKYNGNFMYAATLKGLACHTAFDAGNPGPDYIYGWGVLDMKQAAQAITDNGTKSLIKENILRQGQQQTFPVVASGNGPLSATISWTDPPGSPTPDGMSITTLNGQSGAPTPDPALTDHTPKLVNDLDVRVSDGTTTFYPWVLKPSTPSAPAGTGDNVLDNIEQVFIPNAVAGNTYFITVSHKGALLSGLQDYSLIVTGLGGCASSPLSNADSRINNVTLSNVNNTPPPGCTSYSDFPDLTIQLVQGKTYPLSITMGTCGANFNKAAKVYIDWNSDGVFEANELVATTGIINATGKYTTTITVPNSVTGGNFSLMRVVLTETDDTSTIQPCGNYAKGETEDYWIQFIGPVINAGTVFGNISACAGSASSSPDLQQFMVSGVNLRGNITAVAPAGFEISFASGSGFGNSLTLALSGDSVANTTIYVRSAASAPPGKISGSVALSSTGAKNLDVAVKGTISVLPTVNTVNNQTVTDGAVTTAVNFTGTGNTFTWTNDTPGIGLAASGTSDIPAFTAVNNGGSPVTATITVTPQPSVVPGFAYIANETLNTVSVINTITNQVSTTIPVGNGPFYVAVSPDGSTVYVSNILSYSVSVIDVATNTVIATVPFGSNQPSVMAVTPDGSQVYVVVGQGISIINTATNTVVSPFSIHFAGITGVYAFQEMAFSPDGSKLYITGGLNNLFVVDISTKSLISNIIYAAPAHGIICGGCNGVAVSHDSKRVYVANTYYNNVAVVNIKTNAVIDTIPVGIGPKSICLSPDGNKLYVVNFGYGGDTTLNYVVVGGTLSVINTVTNKVITTLPVGAFPYGVSITPDGSELYVANALGNSVTGSSTILILPGTVSVINTATNTISATVPVGGQPVSIGNFISQGISCSGLPVTFTITVKPGIIIPNTFTPNGDNINDTWNIKYISAYPDCTVNIFDRYGAVVYSSIGYGIPWDGKYKGAKLPVGTYYYIINLKNGGKPFAGSITIIR